MKRFVFALILLFGCQRTPGVIVGKEINEVKGFEEVKLPVGLCQFRVTSQSSDLTYTFVDSCHFYHMYDTIKLK